MTERNHKDGHRTETPDVSHIRNVEVTHEMSDVDVKGILTFAVALTVMTVVVYLLMLLMFNVLNKQEVSKEQKPSPMKLSEKERLPPEPRLQGAQGFSEGLDKSAGITETEEEKGKPKDPLWEIRILRQQWNDVLEHGAKDKDGKVVGLPIDEAMKRTLEGNGLPSRSQAPGDSDYSVQTPTAASSGRLTEKGKQ
jgi:hypothetical protein